MNDVKIRPTIPNDLDALADVLVQVHAIDGYPVEGVADPRAWLELSDPLAQWTALLDRSPVGHVAMTRPAPGEAAPSLLVEREGVPLTAIAVLSRLFVAPTARGRSLAHQLVKEVEERARSTGLRLTLEVMQKDHSAIALYERRGWTRLGTFDHVLGPESRTPAIAMIAPLST